MMMMMMMMSMYVELLSKALVKVWELYPAAVRTSVIVSPCCVTVELKLQCLCVSVCLSVSLSVCLFSVSQTFLVRMLYGDCYLLTSYGVFLLFIYTVYSTVLR